MPRIKRIQPGYSSVGAMDFHKDDDHEEGEDKPRPQYVLDAKTCLVSLLYWDLGSSRLTKLQVNHCQSLQIMIGGWNVWAREQFMQNTR